MPDKTRQDFLCAATDEMLQKTLEERILFSLSNCSTGEIEEEIAKRQAAAEAAKTKKADKTEAKKPS